jgi:hypothetical protein
VAQKIERRPLGCEKRAQLTLNAPDHRSGADISAVANEPGHLDTGIDFEERLLGATRSGYDSGHPGDNTSTTVRSLG